MAEPLFANQGTLVSGAPSPAPSRKPLFAGQGKPVGGVTPVSRSKAIPTPLPADQPQGEDSALNDLKIGVQGLVAGNAANNLVAATNDFNNAMGPTIHTNRGPPRPATPFEQAQRLTAAKAAQEQAVKTIVAATKNAASIPQSEAYKKFANSQGFTDTLNAFLADPYTVARSTVLQNLPLSAPSAVLGIGGSLAGPAGAMAGAGIGSYQMELGGNIQQGLQTHGADLNDEKSILKVWAEHGPEILAYAQKRAAIVAGFDAATAGISSKLALNKEAGTLAGRAVDALKATGVEAAGGAGGEFAAEKAMGEPTQWGQIAAESLGEVVPGVVEFAGQSALGGLGQNEQTQRGSPPGSAEDAPAGGRPAPLPQPPAGRVEPRLFPPVNLPPNVPGSTMPIENLRNGASTQVGPATPEEISILRQTGYDDEQIAAMHPRERAAEVQAGIASGVKPRAGEPPLPGMAPRAPRVFGKPAFQGQGTLVTPAVSHEAAPQSEPVAQPSNAGEKINTAFPGQGKPVQAVPPVQATEEPPRAETPPAITEPPGNGTRQAPITVQTPEHLATAGQNVNPEPTPAQAESGNYAKGHIKFQGMDISIENPKGSVRRGTGPDGKPWETVLPGHYGYIKRTVSKDGDHVDVTIGDHPLSRKAYVIDQIDPATGKHDEPKAFVAVNTEAEAIDLYNRSFSDGSGPSRMGAITFMTTPMLKDWAQSNDTKRPLGYVQKSPETTGSETQAGNKGTPEPAKTEAPATTNLTDAHIAAMNSFLGTKLPITPEAVATRTKFDKQTASRMIQRAIARGQVIQTRNGGLMRAPVRKKPLNVMEAIASYGGIRDDGGELKARDLTSQNTMTPYGPAVRASGHHPDAIRERLVEDGFIHEAGNVSGGNAQTTPEHVYDLMEKAHSGKPVFNQRDQAAAEEAIAEKRNETANPELADLHPVAAKYGPAVHAKVMEALNDAGLTEGDWSPHEIDRVAEMVAKGMDAGDAFEKIAIADLEHDMDEIDQFIPGFDLPNSPAFKAAFTPSQISDNEAPYGDTAAAHRPSEGAVEPVEARQESTGEGGAGAESEAVHGAGETGSEPEEAKAAAVEPGADNKLQTVIPGAEAKPAGEGTKKAERTRAQDEAKVRQQQSKLRKANQQEAGGMFAPPPEKGLFEEPAKPATNIPENIPKAVETPKATVSEKAPESSTKPKQAPLAMVARPQETFYSGLIRAAENLKQEKAPPAQWLATLRNQPGVKPEEINWLGLPEWLSQQTGSVTKAQLLDFLRANQVQVREVVHEQNSAQSRIDAAEDALLSHLMDSEHFSENDARDYIRDAMRDELTKGQIAQQTPRTRELIKERREAWEAMQADGRGDTTKFSSYTLPGGTDYRELLLTLPEKEKPQEVNQRAVNAGNRLADFNRHMRERHGEMWIRKLSYAESDEQRALETELEDAEIGFTSVSELPEGWHTIYDQNARENSRWGVIPAGQRHARFYEDQALPTEAEAVQAALDYYNMNSRSRARQAHEKKLREAQQSGFRSGHFDEPNVVAHVRFNDRTDASGKKTLFLEELQSDFGQQYRKQKQLISASIDRNFDEIAAAMVKAGVITKECD